TPQRVRSGAVAISPFLPGGTKVELVSPAVLGLLVREPVGLGDRARLGETIGRNIPGFDATCGSHAGMDGFAVDAGIDDQVHDVDVLRAQFAGHRLRNGAEAKL